jgi:hypothetical protein
MSFRENFGRCLLVSICVLAGIGKFTDPKPNERTLSDGYSRTFAKAKEYGVVLPLTPQVLTGYTLEVIYLTGALLLLGSLLVIFRVKFGSCLLSSLLVSFCIVIHNPYLYTKDKEFYSHAYFLVLNLGLIAGLSLTCPAKAQDKEKTD